MNNNPKPREDMWQNKFLNAGTEMGLGDLSMMIGTVSQILAEQEAAAKREGLEWAIEIAEGMRRPEYGGSHNGALNDLITRLQSEISNIEE